MYWGDEKTTEEIMSKRLVTIPMDRSMSQAQELMRQKSFRHLPVTDDSGTIIGILSDRDLQRAMAEQKKPWEVGKSFDHGAIIGQLHLASDIGHVALGAITLTVNGQSRQSSDLAHMTWSVAEQVANLSQYYELFPGDIIYAGTPENVGPVVLGDLIVATIAGLDEIHVRIVA